MAKLTVDIDKIEHALQLLNMMPECRIMLVQYRKQVAEITFGARGLNDGDFELQITTHAPADDTNMSLIAQIVPTVDQFMRDLAAEGEKDLIAGKAYPASQAPEPVNLA